MMDWNIFESACTCTKVIPTAILYVFVISLN